MTRTLVESDISVYSSCDVNIYYTYLSPLYLSLSFKLKPKKKSRQQKPENTMQQSMKTAKKYKTIKDKKNRKMLQLKPKKLKLVNM